MNDETIKYIKDLISLSEKGIVDCDENIQELKDDFVILSDEKELAIQFQEGRKRNMECLILKLRMDLINRI